MRTQISLVLFFITLQILSAQTGITGTVTDESSNEKLVAVSVIVNEGLSGTSTDENGSYKLSLKRGRYRLKFTYLGYKTIEKVVSISEGEQSTLDVAMVIDEAKELGMVVVSDGKTSKKVERSPISIDVIKPDALKNNNITSLDKAIEKVSGVQIYDNQVNIRSGSGFSYGAGSRVTFLLDEQPLLSADISDIKWNYVPIENASQIEVIKGSSSVLYGSGALNGVINVRTAVPTDEPYTNFTSYTGVYSAPRDTTQRWWNSLTDHPRVNGAFFSHRRKVNENLDLVLGGNFHLENNIVEKADERRGRLNTLLRWRIPKSEGRFSFALRGNLMYHEVGTYILWKNGNEGAYQSVTNIDYDRYTSFNIDPSFTAYDRYTNKHEIKGRYYDITFHRGGPDSRSFIASLEYQFQRKWENDWSITAGSLIQRFNAKSNLFNDEVTNPGGVQKFTGFSYGVYAQVEKKFSERLSFVAGSRWEAYLFDKQWNTPLPIFRGGLNYQVKKNNYLRASVGQGYRLPSLAERFINEPLVSDFGIYVLPNPSLKPEYGWTAEAGYKKVFFLGKNWKGYADLALFWMEYFNMTEFYFDNWNVDGQYKIGFRSVNVSRARIAGSELSVYGEGKIKDAAMRIWGGYTFTYPGDLVGDTTLYKFSKYIKRFGDAFINGVDSTERGSILKYRSLHLLHLDSEVEWKNFVLGGAVNYSSFMQRIDEAFEGRGPLGPLIELAVPGIRNFREKHNRGDIVLDLRVGYVWKKTNRLNLVINNLLNRTYAIRPGKMNATRLITVKFSRNF